MTRITVRSTEREQILDITPQMRAFAAKAGAKSGLLAVYCPHTTAAISANENAGPGGEERHAAVHAETGGAVARVQARGGQRRGTLLLGHWQEIYFMEFDWPREREIWLKLIAG